MYSFLFVLYLTSTAVPSKLIYPSTQGITMNTTGNRKLLMTK